MRTAQCQWIALTGMIAVATFHPDRAPGATIRDDTADAEYVALANSPQYAAVGLLVNSWGYTSSATLIAPDWILTAAHSLVAASSATFTINGVGYTGTELIRNPNWTGGSPFAGYDFGLVHLSTAVSGVTPATLYTEFGDFMQTGTFVGCGLTGTGTSGATVPNTDKRAFQNTIDADFGNPSLVLGADFDNPGNPADSGFGSSTPLTLEGCVGPGDSGGGVFITTNSITYLNGVIAFVAAADGNANSDYGDVSGFGRVATVYPWIMSTIPEPSTSSLLAGAGLLALRRRRKK